MKRASFLNRRQVRWWKIAPTYTLAISVIWGILVLAAAYGANERFMLFAGYSAEGSKFSALLIASDDTVRTQGASDLHPSDPVARFSETRVGHVLFASRAGYCRRLLFDNQTGSFQKASGCGQGRDQAARVDSAERLTGLQHRFRQ